MEEKWKAKQEAQATNKKVTDLNGKIENQQVENAVRSEKVRYKNADEIYEYND